MDSKDKLVHNRRERDRQRHEARAGLAEEFLQEAIARIPQNADQIEVPQTKEINLFDEVKNILPEDWEYDEQTRCLIFTLIFFFARSERFYDSPILKNKESAAINKGLLIEGSTGLGKTEIIQAFCKALKGTEYEFNYYEVGEICEKWDTADGKTNEEFRIPLTRGRKLCVVDDFGAEVSDKLYRYQNPLPDLISRREKIWRNAGVKTIIITNFSSSELSGVYSARILDRIKGMSNVLKIEGISRR